MTLNTNQREGGLFIKDKVHPLFNEINGDGKIMIDNEKMSQILREVQKPGRYTGGEYGEIIKDKSKIKLRIAFCFPDTYEIGMSNLGVRILAGVFNSYDDIWCERVYAPWVDMDEKMREFDIPLFVHESGDPVSEFDIAAFTLQYELCYTNVLNMLNLSKIPLRCADRIDDDSIPVILGGGPCAYNAEPVADFFDIFSIGEGEESLAELARLYIDMKDSGIYTKKEFLRRAASELEGFYVPSLYEVTYKDDGTVESYTPKFSDVPKRVKRRIIKDMDTSYYPLNPVMPYIETVHDRIMLEVYRGCIRGCRFCQAGMIFRPVREKSPEVLCEQARELAKNTGYDEISLISLSISDYSCLEHLTDSLLEWTDDSRISLSLPSLRADSFTEELMEKVSTVRTTSLTFAPEAGTQRLRDAINKNVTEDEILGAVKIAFKAGKNQVKLYFMNGLPTETYEDIEGISTLASHVVDEYYRNPNRNKAKPLAVTVSVSCFIPKPNTPFQWEAQEPMDELVKKQRYLREKITDRKVRYSWHDAKVSRLEAVFARGDRRLADAIETAVNEGMKFDSWDEFFDYEKWMDIFERCSVDPSFYANREFGEDETLPWDVIDCGVSKEFLLRERHKAYESKTTPNCKEKCSNCGVNSADAGSEGKYRWCPKLK